MNVERFLIQVKQNLPEHDGVTTWVENSALNVGYGKSESFEIRYPGGICYNAATEKTDEFYKLVEEADKAFKTVKEYIDLMDNAPELSARDFNMPYKLLAEFNGVVLGGIEHRSNNSKCIRKAFDKKDFCARYGGDEFICMVNGGVRDKIAEFYRLLRQEKYGISYPLDVSLGTTEYQIIKDKGIDDMVKRCNEIMRKEKKEKGVKQSDKII